MNFDERLERLTERLDALAQSLELTAAMQRDNENANLKMFQTIGNNFEICLDSIKRLENIATAHEQRLDDLDNH
jgi:primosomal protein N''